MLFPHEIEFDPAEPSSALASLPERPAVFALRGNTGEPYLNRTANLRGRLERLLMPAPVHSKRLQLAALVRRIAWVETASELAASVLLYRASSAVFGDRAVQRLRLHVPFFLRMGMPNRFPRLWVTNSITTRSADDLFGPFPSRHAAERYAEGVLDLHLLRRCFQDLKPDPEFPGCIYSEMKKCLAPCFGGCSDERYAAEASAVQTFLRTRGESLLAILREERDRASRELDFEAASAVHARLLKAEDTVALAPEIAGALSAQRAVLVQPSIEPDTVELFGLESGTLAGPVRFSLLGLRLPNEQSGSSSLFAHPAALAPTPLVRSAPSGPAGTPAEDSGGPEDRLRIALLDLHSAGQRARKEDSAIHQALLARWYFRPQGKREGEIVFTGPSLHSVQAVKALLRASARVLRAQIERHAPGQTLVAPSISSQGRQPTTADSVNDG